MSNRSLQDELPTRSTTNTQTLLEICVIIADHKVLEEHLINNLVPQSDLDRYLLRGLQIVQRKEIELSHVTQTLTILLQSGAVWHSDVLLDDQRTPYHIICDSQGDHHELLYLMIKSSQQKTINARDRFRRPALMYAVKNVNINCIKCLIANGADVTIGDDSSFWSRDRMPFTSIIQTIWSFRDHANYSSVIMSDIVDLLLNTLAEQNKDHHIQCAEYICYALQAKNVNYIKKLFKIGTPLDKIVFRHHYVWAWVARQGDLELLKCMINSGIDKDVTDHNGITLMGHVARSGNIEGVRYLIDLGVAIPSYTPEVLEMQCEQCKVNKLIIEDDSKQDIITDDMSRPDNPDPCMIAICENMLEIVKLLDENGSQSCKSFNSLRRAVIFGSLDVVSYLLNKYTYPLNAEYIIKDSGEGVFTLLTEPFHWCRTQIIQLLLDHGAAPAKPMCTAGTANAIMREIRYANLEVIAQYIRSGVDLNLKSWSSTYGGVVSPLEASVVHGLYYASVMFLISGCSRGMFSTRNKLKDKPNLEKLMKEWNVYDNNVTPLQLRCRSVILNHLSPRADKKIRKLPLPGCLIKFLSIPDLDKIVYEWNKIVDKHGSTFM